MNKQDLRNKVRRLIPKVYKGFQKSEEAAVEYDELTKFPELKRIIVDLLTEDFDSFLSSIDWVAPRPTTFRINLRNDQCFYLSYNGISWIAQVEGKRYYLLNLPEEQRAAQSISRILRFGSDLPKGDEEEDNQEDDFEEDFDDVGGDIQMDEPEL